MVSRRLVSLVMLSLLVLPARAAAQREEFFDTLLPLYHALAGSYGDEGTQLTRHLEVLSNALARWDRSLGVSEIQLRARLRGSDSRTQVEVHTVLASLYAERSRFRDALRELDAVLEIEPNRAVFHRFKALLHEASGDRGAAASAFREAWLAEPEDPQNAYRLVVRRSDTTTPAEVARALRTLANVETQLIDGRQAAAEAPFLTLNSISDDVGGAMAFAPAAYAPAFKLLLEGQFDAGMTALRAAIANDPLLVDTGTQSETMARAITQLRLGLVVTAIGDLERAVVLTPESSEAHRILAAAYGINGDVEKSIRHFRTAVRLNPTDERSWLALARTLDTAGNLQDAIETLRTAVKRLPGSAALRWVLAITSEKRQRADDADVELIANADQFVLLAGRSDLYARVARKARGHLEYERAIALLERRVALTPNNVDAHRELGRAYIEDGRDDEGYAELIMALFLAPTDAETLTSLGRVHMAAGRYSSAVEALQRAVALTPDAGPAVQALATALIRSGKADEGEAQLRQADRLVAIWVDVQRRLRTAAMLASQAEIREHEQQYDKAAQLWQQVIELEGESAAVYLRLADALAGAKKFDQAAAHLETAIAMKAGPEAHRRLAETYAALGRTEDSTRERRTYVERRLKQLQEASDVGTLRP